MVNLSITFRTVNLENDLINKINAYIKRNKKSMLMKVEQQIKDAFRYAVNTIYPIQVAKYAPTPAEERTALTTGKDERSRSVGSAGPGRFMKDNFRYLQQVILEDLKMAVETSYWGDGLKLEFYVPKQLELKMSRKIGFAWLKKTGDNSLERRSTIDAEAYHATWNNLLRIWEDGGTIKGTFTVKARDGGKLAPGPDKRIRSEQVTKTIPPKQMFQKAKKSSQRKIRELVRKKLSARYSR